MIRNTLWIIFLSMGTSLPLWAQTHNPTAADLAELVFEELGFEERVNMAVELASAGKYTSRVVHLPYVAHILTAKETNTAGSQLELAGDPVIYLDDNFQPMYAEQMVYFTHRNNFSAKGAEISTRA